MEVKKVVCPEGFKPPTYRTATYCSIQLSYGHKKWNYIYLNLDFALKLRNFYKNCVLATLRHCEIIAFCFGFADFKCNDFMRIVIWIQRFRFADFLRYARIRAICGLFAIRAIC